MTSVEIPLQGSDTEVIEISFDELPDDVEEVMHILKAENAQMYLWVTIAIEYYRRDKKENFTKVSLGIWRPNLESTKLMLSEREEEYTNIFSNISAIAAGGGKNRSKRKLRKSG